MRLKKARITNYRSVKDSGSIELEPNKTILVGPNEAGKSALLKALQQINPPAGVPGFDALRDYPRGDYNDITSKRLKPEDIKVAVAHFELEDDDKKRSSPSFTRPLMSAGETWTTHGGMNFRVFPRSRPSRT